MRSKSFEMQEVRDRLEESRRVERLFHLGYGNNRRCLPDGRKGMRRPRMIEDVKKKIHARERKALAWDRQLCLGQWQWTRRGWRQTQEIQIIGQIYPIQEIAPMLISLIRLSHKYKKYNKVIYDNSSENQVQMHCTAPLVAHASIKTA